MGLAAHCNPTDCSHRLGTSAYPNTSIVITLIITIIASSTSSVGAAAAPRDRAREGESHYINRPRTGGPQCSFLNHASRTTSQTQQTKMGPLRFSVTAFFLVCSATALSNTFDTEGAVDEQTNISTNEDLVSRICPRVNIKVQLSSAWINREPTAMESSRRSRVLFVVVVLVLWIKSPSVLGGCHGNREECAMLATNDLVCQRFVNFSLFCLLRILHVSCWFVPVVTTRGIPCSHVRAPSRTQSPHPTPQATHIRYSTLFDVFYTF